MVRSRHEEPSPNQRRRSRLYEVGLKDSSLVMPFLRPGIREVDMDSMDALCRQAELHELTAVEPLDAKVRQTQPRDLHLGDPDVVGNHLDTEEVPFRVLTGFGEDETPATGSDLDLDGGDPAKKLLEASRFVCDGFAREENAWRRCSSTASGTRISSLFRLGGKARAS
jgi:hypothetical protein